MVKNKIIYFFRDPEGDPSLAVIRLYNRRIIVMKNKETVSITTTTACADPEKPATTHNNIRGKIRLTEISFSFEAIESISIALQYLGFGFSRESSPVEKKISSVKIKCDICGYVWDEDGLDKNKDYIKCPHCKQDAYYDVIK